MFHHLYFEYLLNYVRVIRTSQVVSLIFTNSLTPATPVVENFWIFTSLTSNLLLPTMLYNISASTTIILSGLSRSPFGFGSNVSLSTLYYCRYLQQHKTRYMVDLASPSITGLSPVRLIHLILTHRLFFLSFLVKGFFLLFFW
ncbi:Uncharacterised protein [Orientia tsutsugamushi]|nr:hypothetical protein OTSTA763_1516 [Orientia tsutsugamushi str. TA763]SPP23693.1 Uncharacterised protein [Orientia tsutsugamushi]